MSPTQIELGVSNNNHPAEKADTKEKSFNIKEFLGEVNSEYQKISWPSKDQVSTEFIAVLILVVVLSGIIYILDLTFGYVSNFFMGNV